MSTSPKSSHSSSPSATPASHDRANKHAVGPRIGDHGPTVEALQKKLGLDKPDGSFGPATDKALRNFQRKHGLVPDGIAGSRTMALLEGQHKPIWEVIADVVARLPELPTLTAAMLRSATRVLFYHARPPNTMRMLDAGKQFLYHREAWKGVSNHLHHPEGPEGISGVTLGPGYDMKRRSPKEIERDMRAIGLGMTVATKIAEAAGKSTQDAQDFCDKNKKLVNLEEWQELKLLEITVPKYEDIVRRTVQVPLVQHEFDALASFTYNWPDKMEKVVAPLINAGKIVDAMNAMKKDPDPRRAKRRELEVTLYLTGEVPHRQTRRGAH
jgi:GH24 family phage-related lysozyme (muramidase)